MLFATREQFHRLSRRKKWTHDRSFASPLNLQTIGEKGFFRVKVEE